MTIVTLIHGTWARGADWTKESSPLARALRERIKGDVQVTSFSWSGSNLHFARRRAAARLQQHVLSLALQHPDASQFVIAHSHGGNVALYALENVEVKQAVTGVICLSTPFIQCRARSFPSGMLTLLFAIVVLAAVFFLSPYLPDWLPDQLLVITAAIITGGIALAIRGAISYLVLGNPKGTFPQIFERIVQSFSFVPLSPDRLLVLRAPGDEASAALGASMFASLIFGKLSSSVYKVYMAGEWLRKLNERLGWRRRFLAALCAFAITGFCFYCILNLDSDSLWFPVSFIVGFILMAVAWCFLLPQQMGLFPLGFNLWGQAMQLAYVVLVTPLLILSSLFSAVFGFDVALAAILLDFSVDSSPVGTFSVVSLRAPTTRGLWHSLPYSDPEAFEAIVNWVNRPPGPQVGG